MPRRIRHVRPRAVYDVTSRTRDGRLAFVPTHALVDELTGVVGEAQRRWPQVLIHNMFWLSNHTHMQLSVVGGHAMNTLSKWTNYVFGESAKVAQAIHGLRGEIWESKRYRLIEIIDEPRQRDRIKYTMAQACAAGLVARPGHWPGLNTVNAMCRGERIVGYRGSAALRRRARIEGVSMASIAPAREVRITPLPMHAGWSDHKQQRWHREIEREIITETAAEFPGRAYPMPESYVMVSPEETRPLTPSDAPTVWASPDNHEGRQTWRVMIRAFTQAWREALAAWIGGARACFPPCGWVPFGACYAPGYAQRE